MTARRRSFKVPVALVEYTVKLEPGRIPDPDDPTEDLQGLVVFDDRTIRINNDQSESGVVLTFWHEYLHALLHENGNRELCENEGLVEALAQSLVRAIRAVPKRFKDPD